jgi:hypothetical protein
LNSGQTAVSVSGRSVRLTRERWGHIERRHPEMRGWQERVLEGVRDPKFVAKGRSGELLAVRSTETAGANLFLVVIYRESGEDGFIITAFLTSDVKDLGRREKLWPSPF